MTAPEGDKLRFDVHPSVIFQLGADLISDDVQALIELAKNSYDALASYVHIDIDTKATADSLLPDTFFSGAPGVIRVTDDGEGMDLGTIRRGWLTVSNSPKRAAKAQGISDDQRTPLGDKGLGRLASQRLASNIEIVTVAKGAKQQTHVGLSWAQFSKHQVLSEVPIFGPTTRPASLKRGTVVVISGLLEPDRWRGGETKHLLADRFAELISPFESIKGFELVITVDGETLDLARIRRRLRTEADATFEFAFDRTAFKMTGHVKLRELEPQGAARRLVFQQHCKRDGGKKLLEFLQAKSKDSNLQIASAAGEWFAAFQRSCKLAELNRADHVAGDGIANPGPFRGEVDSYDLSPARGQSALGRGHEMRGLVKRLSGVRVYRDGFGVRVDRDILRLSEAWTTGRSWYGLKPANTIGYIAISARGNPELVETTDREGFKRTPHYRNFEYLLDQFRSFTHDALEFARRTTIAFCDRFIQERAAADAETKPDELLRRVGEHLRQAAVAGDKITAARKRIASSTKEVKRASDRRIMTSAEHSLAELSDLLKEIPRVRDTLHLLQAQVERFNDRLGQAYETMGVGLTAEALVHEISTIADGLAERVLDIRRRLREASAADESVRAFVRHVDAAVSALRKQVGHLDPALRYVRERRQVVDVNQFLTQLKEYHEGRWRDGAITMLVSSLSKTPFEVMVNPGKLTQIFDNLILNSEYWIRDAMRLEGRKKGRVLIETEAPFVWVSDDGRGIDPSVESALFEPFVTTKRSGRGLGLFIVREFLGSEGSTISLYQERNPEGRFFAFELDLSGMLNGRTDR